MSVSLASLVGGGTKRDLDRLTGALPRPGIFVPVAQAFRTARTPLSRISETTTLLVVTHHEIDDLLNEWMAEQRNPSLTKSMVIDMALREWLIARGRSVARSPLALEDELLQLVEKAFPDKEPPDTEKPSEDFLTIVEDTGPDEPSKAS
jgi:hypothetical protein